VLRQTRHIKSIFEVGANIGLNLRAIQHLLPEVKLSALEINATAVEELKRINNINVYHQSLLDFTPSSTFDLVLIKGVLIHINPTMLLRAYELLYKTSA